MKRVLLVIAAVAIGAAGARTPVAVTGAWARASLPGQSMAALYFTLTSPADDALTRVEATGAAASIHRTVRQDMEESMEAVPRVALPAGLPVAFAPGGSHVMLMLPPGEKLRAGAYVRLTLHFEHAPDERVDVPVLSVRATGP